MNVPFPNRSVALVGAAHLDHVAQADGRLTAGASNPGLVRETIGGAAFNAALALRRFETEVDFLGVRGGDAAGDRVAGALAAAGITDRSVTWLDRATPRYTAILDDTGELLAGIADMALYDKFSARLLSRRSLRDWLRGAPTILVDANLPAEALQAIARTSTGRLAAIAVSPAKALRLVPILQRLDALFLSRREAAVLAELPAETLCSSLVRCLAEIGVRRAVVTDGPRPAAILEENLVHLQMPPAIPSVLDVTGAGDTLAAIALLGWVEGRRFPDAVRLGMAAASLRITGRLQTRCRSDCEAIAAELPLPETISGQDA